MCETLACQPEELVVGDAEGDFEYMFGRTPPRIAVAADGRIVVLDGGNDSASHQSRLI